MPYISEEKREKVDPVLNFIISRNIKPDGELNYLLYKYCKYHIAPSYNNYKNFCGELRQCITEIERRLLAPYEDDRIKENGDV